MESSVQSATEIATQVRRGTLNPTDFIDTVLDRITRRNDRTNAFVEITADDARSRAMSIEHELSAGRSVGPLAGVPVALKESASAKSGVKRTMGSVPFRGSVSETDSTFVTRLESAGAVVVGTTNTPEMDHKGTTDNPLVGPTLNPFDLSRNAGGSSGGSAAAVAGGLVPIAHGKDAGGSLRIPAAWSGVYAFKPTFRRVPNVTRPDGFADELGIRSSHGPITRSVEDAALVLDVIGGHHPRDPASLPVESESFREAVDQPIDGYSIAYTPDFGTFPVEPAVRTTVDNALETFSRAGATVERVTMEIGYTHSELTETWLALVGANLGAFAEWLAEHDGIDLLGEHRNDCSDGLVSLIESGMEMTATEYLHHHVVRTAVHDAFEDVFETYDLLVSPTVCCSPIENATDESTSGPTAVDGVAVDPRIGWCQTFLCNFTGHPAASIPAGTDPDGLPVGLQLIGQRFDDAGVFSASGAIERRIPWPTP
ncbi:amidase [Halocatena halophila]|uniref:amidase n=1 Tax=Halocatena halophila TaxID=2814576 RepID=UPI002ECFD2D4